MVVLGACASCTSTEASSASPVPAASAPTPSPASPVAPPASVAQTEPAWEKSPPADAERSASGLASKVLAAGHGDARPQPHDEVRVE